MVKNLTAEEVAYKLFTAAKSKAGTRGRNFALDYTDVLALVRSGYCPRTGILFDMSEGRQLPFRPSLDRIDNDKGYTLDNIQVVCKIYNTAKWAWTDEDVFRMSESLVNFSR